ncbi:MAG: hypothetical protein DWQ08_13055 [Proteobacteria bacterium]|nr:MAG: hypothetical protein DWQ08_13055 [Pseudomonadota bacterium]
MKTNDARADFHFAETMNVRRRPHLVFKLEREKGVSSAWFDSDDPARLVVFYDPEWFSHVTLLDAMQEFGYQAELAA